MTIAPTKKLGIQTEWPQTLGPEVEARHASTYRSILDASLAAVAAELAQYEVAMIAAQKALNDELAACNKRLDPLIEALSRAEAEVTRARGARAALSAPVGASPLDEADSSLHAQREALEAAKAEFISAEREKPKCSREDAILDARMWAKWHRWEVARNALEAAERAMGGLSRRHNALANSQKMTFTKR